MFTEPISPRSHVIVIESSSPREEKSGSISPRRGDASPRYVKTFELVAGLTFLGSGIDSSTPRAPPPIENLKPARSESTVVPPPRPPRKLVRTNSEGATTRSKIEPPPVRRRESDAPEMRGVVNSHNNNNNNVGEPEPAVKLVR